MKIIFFIGYYPEIIGGAQLQTKILYDQLKNYYNIVYISYHYNNPINEKNIYRLNFPSKIHKFTLYYFWMKKVKKILIQEKPDFVYQRVLNSFSMYLASYCNELNIPFFIHVADNYSLEFNTFSLSTLVRRIFFTIILRRNVRFLCQTDYQKKLLSKYFKDEIYLIPNIYPFRNFDVVHKSQRNYFIWIGNIRKVKRIDLYINLARNFPNIKFYVLGEVSNNIYGYLIKKKLREVKNIHYFGSVNRDKIFNLLSNSIALVNTSDSEGLSNTFIEAWQTGTPVISLNSNPNYYFDRFNLGIFCNGSIDNLYNSVKTFVQMNDVDYQNLSTSCYEFAKQEFSIEDKLPLFFKLFSK